MNDAEKATWMEDIYPVAAAKAPKPRRNRKDKSKLGHMSIDLGTCPRSADQVYSLGINVQYCIGDVYLELSSLNQEPAKSQYKNMAMRQLDGKNEIEKLANINLNRLLTYFYNNGGQVIEPPLNDEMARQIKPFFSRMADNFIKQLNIIAGMAAKNNLSGCELEHTLNETIIDMYNTMSMFFPVDEIRNAFSDLIEVRENINNK